VRGDDHAVIDKLREYRSLGIEEVICWFTDTPDLGSLTAFAERTRETVA
jgi:hypothetical protein